MDSNISWVVHGQGESIGFVASDGESQGHDVYAGNLRGVNPVKFNKSKKENDASYWDSNIDDFVLQDIPAFIHKIVQIKTEELRDFHK